ncbi:hypothetical protein MTP09_11635 [Chryseobacterium suipulveris]|uniref:Uncharacterized protein n=1 Tax=Chryseobacterium suipulveris TaxID=2929800 RepID=A0ABY4BMY0_9FLAO|nr:hypothetical protein [Chryseobacterium suipulveris]UOE40552.1 hypothetical protein MTP09_11635 [Chryseobacterium suipulveris]
MFYFGTGGCNWCKLQWLQWLQLPLGARCKVQGAVVDIVAMVAVDAIVAVVVKLIAESRLLHWYIGKLVNCYIGTLIHFYLVLH